jgi:pullulanase
MDNNKIAKLNNYYSTIEFEEDNNYQGRDLGAIWTKTETRFRVWAPTATSVNVNLYETGDQDDLIQTIPMFHDSLGTWSLNIDGDLDGLYYTYTVNHDGEITEAVDPYAKAVGVNGRRGMVVDLSSTDPEGFREEEKPRILRATDAIIYELHVRDFSIDESSGMKYKGKYLAFTEAGTTNSYGDSTGIDYLKELGITHVHLLPVFDFMSIDEARLEDDQFNWGYDPLNYNVPEGSYSTDPYDGKIRIIQFKQMIQSLHKAGIRVIMDVVYNHTMQSKDSNFNLIVPGYYYRYTRDGHFSNASGCGNETASERIMMRKFIIDSVIYWAKEYHIDGFRFDLMGIHDLQTMNQIRYALNALDPSILLYGEGWTGGLSPLPDWERALKENMSKLDRGIAAFSDNIRDAIKGSVFSAHIKGFVNGKDGLEETIKFGIVGGTLHQDVDYARVHYTNIPWASDPTQCINYASAHDNLTLWDKLQLSRPECSREVLIKMNLLSAAIVLTSQGIPFFQAGEEFLRSKPLNEEETIFEENSYRSPDYVNSLKWDRSSEYPSVFHYYKGLIELRKKYKAFRMTRSEKLRQKLQFLPWTEPNVVSYLLSHKEEEICVILNGDSHSKRIYIPEGEWNVYVKGNLAGTQVLESFFGNVVTIEPISALIMIKTTSM